MQYRSEIDGLRAVAIIPVILCHAGFKLFSGGFVGVDIFFVISGYLITTILIEDIENDRFSIVKFYERRARRILPALFFLIIACIPFAWAWMLPSEMEGFSKSIIAVVFFASNVLFWQESGYFDSVAEKKPLLHTWSLAVEEQYYLLFPIFLFFAWRFGRKRVVVTIFVIAVLSLLLSEWGWRNAAIANFYLAPTRAWELLAGAMAAFFVQKKGVQSSNVLSLVGLIGIVFAILIYNKNTPFPSLYTLVPVLGAVLMILFADKRTLVAKALRSKGLVGIGLISYSAYLWHQPIFSFVRIKFDSPSLIIFTLLIIVTFIFSYLSWKYVENPFREKDKFSTHKVFSYSMLGMLIFLIIGGSGLFSKGFSSQRYDQKFLSRNDIGYLRSSRKAFLGNPAVEPSWILIGDSHADSLQDGFSEYLVDYNEAAVVSTKAGCPPAVNLWRYDMDYKMSCHDHYLNVLKIIKEENIKNVFVSARYALYLNSDRFNNKDGGVERGVTERVVYDQIHFRDTIRSDKLRHQAIELELIDYINKITSMNVNVFMLTSIPEVGWNVPVLISKQRENILTRKSVYDDRVKPLGYLYSSLSSNPKVKLLRSEKVFCDDIQCIASENFIPLYYDSNHPSIYGARKIIDYFKSDLFENDK